MKRTRSWGLWLGLWALAFSGVVWSQPAPKKRTGVGHSVPAARASAKSKSVALPSAVQEPLSPEHLALAQRVYVGQFPCELSAKVSVSPDAANSGYFVVQTAGQRYWMAPVLTTTGAIRLEDKRAGAVWLQLANKSMLMNQMQGRRLADACMSEEQLAMAQAMLAHPQPDLLGASPSNVLADTGEATVVTTGGEAK